MTTVITEPGAYVMSDAEYHADAVPGGSLSSTGARKLLPPSCPAIYRYETDHAQPHKRHFDVGHGAHYLVLGAGPEPALVDFDSWRTNKAKEEGEAAREAGKTPLLRAEWDKVHAMADALRADRECAALLDPEHGTAELSLFWTDPDYDVWRRARPDWINHRPGRRPVIVDYKSTTALDDRAISKTIHSFGYHQQQPYYLDGAWQLGWPDAAFVFLFQLKTEPYLVRIVQLHPDDVEMGRARNRAALERFRDCQKTGIWPGYPHFTEIRLPRYASYQWADEQDMTDDN